MGLSSKILLDSWAQPPSSWATRFASEFSVFRDNLCLLLECEIPWSTNLPIFLDLNQNIITSPLPLFSDREGNTTLKIYKFVSLFVKESVVNRFSDQYFGRFAIDN